MERDPGQVLALQGDPGSGMFVILDGTVTVEWRGGSVELEAGELLRRAHAARPGRHANRCGCARRGPVKCVAIARDDALALLESEPSVTLAMLREVARRFASALPDS